MYQKYYTSDKILDNSGKIIQDNIHYKIYLVLEPLANVSVQGANSLPYPKIDVIGNYT